MEDQAQILSNGSQSEQFSPLNFGNDEQADNILQSILNDMDPTFRNGLEEDLPEEDNAHDIPSSSTSPPNGEQAEQPSVPRSALYKQKRAKNNESVKKCREKAKQRTKELEERNKELERDNKRLREENYKMSKELTVVRLLFQENNNRSADK